MLILTGPHDGEAFLNTRFTHTSKARQLPTSALSSSEMRSTSKNAGRKLANVFEKIEHVQYFQKTLVSSQHTQMRSLTLCWLRSLHKVGFSASGLPICKNCSIIPFDDSVQERKHYVWVDFLVVWVRSVCAIECDVFYRKKVVPVDICAQM